SASDEESRRISAMIMYIFTRFGAVEPAFHAAHSMRRVRVRRRTSTPFGMTPLFCRLAAKQTCHPERVMQMPS
ncbi:MAG: hypothetical protein P1S60_19550, partial [Anaerolineae bacterium]|nr:hypothetical protein [Anaerolineae bacterium]